MVIKINSIDQFKQVIDTNEKVFIIKHSKTCPISQSAYDQFEKFLYERDIDGYAIIVQDAREVSDYVASYTNVKHESPQAFYFVNQQVKWHDSHGNITISSLSNAEE